MIVINIEKARAIAIKKTELVKDATAKLSYLATIAQAATLQELAEIMQSIEQTKTA